jgi:hypothetical protein
MIALSNGDIRMRARDHETNMSTLTAADVVTELDYTKSHPVLGAIGRSLEALRAARGYGHPNVYRAEYHIKPRGGERYFFRAEHSGITKRELDFIKLDGLTKHTRPLSQLHGLVRTTEFQSMILRNLYDGDTIAFASGIPGEGIPEDDPRIPTIEMGQVIYQVRGLGNLAIALVDADEITTRLESQNT